MVSEGGRALLAEFDPTRISPTRLLEFATLRPTKSGSDIGVSRTC